jgi:hypothetical protein
MATLEDRPGHIGGAPAGAGDPFEGGGVLVIINA